MTSWASWNGHWLQRRRYLRPAQAGGCDLPFRWKIASLKRFLESRCGETGGASRHIPMWLAREASSPPPFSGHNDPPSVSATRKQMKIRAHARPNCASPSVPMLARGRHEHPLFNAVHRVPFYAWRTGIIRCEIQGAEIREQVTLATKQLKEERESLHIVEAEWTYLNRPQRLQDYLRAISSWCR